MENQTPNTVNENQEQNAKTSTPKTYTQDDVDNLLNIQKRKLEDLTNSYNQTVEDFKSFKQTVENEKRTEALLKAGVDEKQIKNVGIILKDVPTNELAKVLQSDDSYLVFLKPTARIKQEPQQQTTSAEELEKQKQEEASKKLKKVYPNGYF